MGGQTALNLAMEAKNKGVLKKYNIDLIGANSSAIANAEDRKKFRKNMSEIGLDLPKSKIVNKEKDAKKALRSIGLPAIIRPAFSALIAKFNAVWPPIVGKIALGFSFLITSSKTGIVMGSI